MCGIGCVNVSDTLCDLFSCGWGFLGLTCRCAQAVFCSHHCALAAGHRNTGACVLRGARGRRHHDTRKERGGRGRRSACGGRGREGGGQGRRGGNGVAADHMAPFQRFHMLFRGHTCKHHLYVLLQGMCICVCYRRHCTQCSSSHTVTFTRTTSTWCEAAAVSVVVCGFAGLVFVFYVLSRLLCACCFFGLSNYVGV
jgi:hypothetical protein